MDREAGNGSGPAEIGTGSEETVEMVAQRLLQKVSERLAAGVARSEEHRLALEAVILLPEPSAWQWLEELRFAFAYVHASECGAHHGSEGVSEACENGA